MQKNKNRYEDSVFVGDFFPPKKLSSVFHGFYLKKKKKGKDADEIEKVNAVVSRRQWCSVFFLNSFGF